MDEKLLERKLTRRLGELGVIALKYTNPFVSGYPDRLCLCPGGTAFWVELKTTGQKPRPLQRLRHEQLRALGYTVFVVDDKQTLDLVVSFARNQLKSQK